MEQPTAKLDEIEQAARAIFDVMPYTGPVDRMRLTWDQEEASTQRDEALRYARAAVRAVTQAPQAAFLDEDEPEACEACGEALQLGDPVYWGDGLLHALCCGPERDGFHNANEAPLADGEPIPRPMIWNGNQGAAELASDARNDELCVDRFGLVMKAKLAAARCKGRAGWDDPAQCSMADLSAMLIDHVAKGDPVDVANFAMMLHNRGGRIETPSPQTGLVAQPLSEWHEDDGFVTWWKFPVNEPSYIGSPLCSDWPGYHTHWTPHPEIPTNADALAAAEGSAE